MKSYSGQHVRLGELGNFSDGSGSSLLEGDFMEPLVEINGIISGDGFKLLSLLILGHCILSFSNNYLLIIFNLKPLIKHKKIQSQTLFSMSKILTSLI